MYIFSTGSWVKDVPRSIYQKIVSRSQTLFHTEAPVIACSV